MSSSLHMVFYVYPYTTRKNEEKSYEYSEIQWCILYTHIYRYPSQL